MTYLLTFGIGLFFGITIMCLSFIAREEDKESEDQNNAKK